MDSGKSVRLTKKLCEFCGLIYVPKQNQPNQRFCSEKCRRRKQDKRVWEKAYQRRCERFGGESNFKLYNRHLQWNWRHNQTEKQIIREIE